jgi:hypothetical protein
VKWHQQIKQTEAHFIVYHKAIAAEHFLLRPGGVFVFQDVAHPFE